MELVTAVDTNVLLDILVPDLFFAELSGLAFSKARKNGKIVVCDVVYAEFASEFWTAHELAETLNNDGIVRSSFSNEALFLAGQRWMEYRRRGGPRNRIMADFLIGAHASSQATRLLTRDTGFYRTNFPSLEVLDPTATR